MDVPREDNVRIAPVGLSGGSVDRCKNLRGTAVRRVESSVADEIAVLIEADIDPDHRRLLAHGLVGLAEATSRQWVART